MRRTSPSPCATPRRPPTPRPRFGSDAQSESPAEEDQALPAVPSFGVLFQAPDVTKAPTRPSRRAGAKAGPPAPAEAEVPTPDTDDSATGASDVAAETSDEQDSEGADGGRRRRRRGGKGRGRGRSGADDSSDGGDTGDRAGGAGGRDQEAAAADADADAESDAQGDDREAHDDTDAESQSTRRRRRRRRGGAGSDEQDPPGTVTRVREARRDEPQSVKGSTRLEAKKQRRREGREAGRRRTVITEAEFLARRESVERVMVVRQRDGTAPRSASSRTACSSSTTSPARRNASMAGNVYLGRVQNVLPRWRPRSSTSAGAATPSCMPVRSTGTPPAWTATSPKRIEHALKSGDAVLVQVTKDPIGHKGARLTSQISLPGRYLVYVPERLT